MSFSWCSVLKSPRFNPILASVFLCVGGTGGLLGATPVLHCMTSADGMWALDIDDYCQPLNLTPPSLLGDNLFQILYYEITSVVPTGVTHRVETNYTRNPAFDVLLPNSASCRLEHNTFPGLISINVVITMLDGPHGGVKVEVTWERKSRQPITVKPFIYVDYDINGTPDDDSVMTLVIPGFEQFNFTPPANPLRFQPISLLFKSFEADVYPALLAKLDAGTTQLSGNIVGIEPPADYTTALSWDNGMLEGPIVGYAVSFRLGAPSSGGLPCLPPSPASPGGAFGGEFVVCADLDSNGVRDDNCVWSACEEDSCTAIDIAFADMGGAFGACPPDGFTNIHDRTHALTCFGGTNPCDSINIDAGGPFGACPPDGFCNIFDATHALTAFGGVNPCTCPAGAQPQAAPHVAGKAELIAQAAPQKVRPGQTADVRVLLVPEPAGLEALQGYQLHLNVSGGKRGSLELVDIRIEVAANPAFDESLSRYEAFNLVTGQMLCGLDGTGVPIAEAVYLATFTYRASEDAQGSFVVDIRRNEADGDQTFLVADFNDQIAVEATQPAVITVAGRLDAPAR